MIKAKLLKSVVPNILQALQQLQKDPTLGTVASCDAEILQHRARGPIQPRLQDISHILRAISQFLQDISPFLRDLSPL
jgi:hypothetical protein